MPRRSWDRILYGIAEDQLGYFTAAQANAAGMDRVRLVQLATGGTVERISRGVYRLAHYPLSPLGQYMEAVLWPHVRRDNTRAAISHASALAIHRLSDVAPAKVHITLPTEIRIRRDIPRHLVIHRADLLDREIQLVEAIPVTTPERTIRDAHHDRIGPALVRQAIEDAARSGVLTQRQADELERELLGQLEPETTAATRAAGVSNGAPT